MVKISVVVPVYNTEKYLPQCIDSLVNQTLKEVEFIFVDDGSTDNSVGIIEDYQKNDDRIKFLRQKNQYAGVARNNGMNHATGKYIIFLDSDDFFEENMLEEAFGCAEANQAEIVIFDYWRYDDSSKENIKMNNKQFPMGVFSHNRITEDFFSFYIPAPWNKLFLRKFIIDKRIEFKAQRRVNDVFFTYISSILATRMIHLEKCFVHYRVNYINELRSIESNRDCFLACAVDMKNELEIREIKDENIRKACYKAACQQIRVGNTEINNLFEEKKYYMKVKELLIPYIFSTEEDFQKDQIITDIFNSENYEDYLFIKNNRIIELLDHYKKQYVPRECIDYRVGHFLMYLPKKMLVSIRKFLQK